jgi:single-strand DNA-binding protein
MYNKSTIIGRLGTDPEVRFTQDQKAIANLRVATTES